MIENSTDKKFIEMDDRNNPLMTLKTLKFYCEKESLPSEPELNQVLYLQYKGFQRIIPETISVYINLRVLHLNNNGIKKIEGLHMLRELHTLYLNNNYIQKIQGLEELHQMKVLNLSHNKLDHVSGLDNLSNLRNLNLSQNFFTKAKDLEGLLPLTNLDLLNLCQNQLQPTQEVFEMITQLQNLTVLYLKSTPLCNLFKNYRKRLIFKLRKLKFLDNRPVLPIDHQLAEAWNEGGSQKQTELKSKMIDFKRQESQKEIEEISKRSQGKSKDQNSQSSALKPIVYEKSQKPEEDSGLNSAYLPKNRTKLQKFLNGDVPSPLKKPVNQMSQKAEKQEIIQKVQSILGSQKSAQQQEQEQVKLKRQIAKKWNKKYEKLLEELLLKYKFDFSEAQPSFNMILSNINKRLMKPVVRFEIVELRHVWTEVQKERRAQQQKALSQKSIEIKQNLIKMEAN